MGVGDYLCQAKGANARIGVEREDVEDESRRGFEAELVEIPRLEEDAQRSGRREFVPGADDILKAAEDKGLRLFF